MEEIVLENVSYKYKKTREGKEKYALWDISLSIGRGEFIAIIGRTGSGKSTLIQHFNGLLKPEKGKCFFHGKNIWEKGYSMSELRKKAALCFQYPEYQLFEETVFKDISFGLKNLGCDKEECEQRTRRAMQLFNLPPEVENVSPFALSGGQKRRVALAGIVVMEPEYLILDEPMAGMDAQGKKSLFQLLHQLNQEKKTTIVMISHNMDEVAEHAGRILVMDKGRLAMDGTPSEVFSQEEEIKKMGLRLPQAAEFYFDLQKRNPFFLARTRSKEEIPLTPEELARVIAEVFAEKSGGTL